MKGPKESKQPRRRSPTTQGSELRRADRSWGSEAMSRHDMFVPVAYAVPETTAVAEAVVEAREEPTAPTLTEIASSSRCANKAVALVQKGIA